MAKESVESAIWEAIFKGSGVFKSATPEARTFVSIWLVGIVDGESRLDTLTRDRRAYDALMERLPLVGWVASKHQLNELYERAENGDKVADPMALSAASVTAGEALLSGVSQTRLCLPES